MYDDDDDGLTVGNINVWSSVETNLTSWRTPWLRTRILIRFACTRARARSLTRLRGVTQNRFLGDRSIERHSSSKVNSGNQPASQPKRAAVTIHSVTKQQHLYNCTYARARLSVQNTYNVFRLTDCWVSRSRCVFVTLRSCETKINVWHKAERVFAEIASIACFAMFLMYNGDATRNECCVNCYSWRCTWKLFTIWRYACHKQKTPMTMTRQCLWPHTHINKHFSHFGFSFAP